MAEEELVGLPREGTPLDRWVPVLYDELRALAGKLLSDKGAAVTLQPTSLVHEAYLRLVGQRRMDWQDRLHFFAVAARVMRRVLVDHCRARVTPEARRRVSWRWSSSRRRCRRRARWTCSPSTGCSPASRNSTPSRRGSSSCASSPA